MRQRFPRSPALDPGAAVRLEFAALQKQIRPGANIAVAVGSRGISNLQAIVLALLDLLKSAGARPFIVPAMGSHGGATPEGQRALLAEYGISEPQLGVPIQAGMEVERLGVTDEGIEVFFSAEALRADGIVLVNRIKPHTDFGGSIGSGLLKMLVVGLGKRTGAANYHLAASRLGYEQVIRSIARVTLSSAPIIGGVAIIEDQFHETARIAVLPRAELVRGEEELFVEARRLMPQLPFDEIDLLIVDRIGKNISGAGMDPNILGRGVHGYSSLPADQKQARPAIRRIFVRDLTPETHGNAIGIGLADLTTTRLVRAMDARVTYINALTSLTPNGAKIPIHFETDREAIAQGLASLGLPETGRAKVVRIANTLALEHLEVSEAYVGLIQANENLEVLGGAEEMSFDVEDNLTPLGFPVEQS